MCLLAICISSLENVYSAPLSIFKSGCLFFVVEFMSFLYTLDINPLSDISFVIIFSHLVGCLLFYW